MASTIQLQRTINRSSQFIRLAPLTFASNTANDPAFSNADWVMQTILAPPFAWRWNRNSTATPTAPTFTTTPGVSDYPVSLPNFGWIEKAVGYDVADGFRAFELQVGLVSGGESLQNEPARIAAQYDDDSGNIVFRLFPPPDDEYNIVVEWQKAAPLFTVATQTWAPIPDYMSYIYNMGFDALSFQYMNDPRFQGTMQLFYTELANVSEGLTESQKNIWLQDRVNSIREMNKVQQGR
jgi:hypothetical protein